MKAAATAGNGQRVQKVGGGNTIVTIFAGAQALAEYYNGAAPSSPTNEYIYAGSLKVASIQSGTTNYWHNDHLSPRVRTDTSGNVSDQRGTFPFGETWYSPGASPYMFTTYYRDYEASGNDYAQARTDVGGLGRFSSPDLVAGSISDPQSLNRYSYVRNMPVMLTDPFGTCPGGFAQYYGPHQDQDQSPDSKPGGPSNTDSDSEQITMNGRPSWAVGPCMGFDDQGGGGGVGNDPFFNDPQFGSIYNHPIGMPVSTGGSGIGDLSFLGPGGGGTGLGSAQFATAGPTDPCPDFFNDGAGFSVSMGACGGGNGGACNVDGQPGICATSGALVDRSGSGSSSDPGGPYPNPAIAQSILKGIGYQLRYAVVQQVCGQNEGRRVLRSMRNGAIVGATKGAYTGFVSGELFGGEVTLGASGLGGAALGGFVGGTVGAMKGVFIGTAAALVCKAGGAYN